MIPPTGNCYQVQCTTGVTVTDTNYLQSVVLPGGSSSNLIYNDLYLIVCLRKLLLLSGDVELNPGPMIDDQPDISLLTQWLEPLVDWKPFGLGLPKIIDSDVLKIEKNNPTIDEQKLALYSKWLKVAPKATWVDVINALSNNKENKLVQDIRKNLQRSAPLPASSYVAVTRQSSQAEVMFETAEDEQEILDTLIGLNKKFSSLMMHVRLGLDEKTEKDPKVLRSLTLWLEAYMHLNDKLTNASLDETFKIIHPYYDFIDCSLIVDMSEIFLNDFKFSDDGLNIFNELKNFKTNADKLRFSVQVKHLHKSLKTIYEGHVPDTSNMPMISMKLHNPWHGSNINGLSLLIHNLLPVGHQQSIMKYITITSGSVIIKYSVYGSTADSLIEYTGGKLQFMRLIGIFSLYINDHPVLQEDENMNFTFELALLEAVTAGNNEAVEILLQLGTVNIDHTNEEGKTALMLASERGHEDIVHSLLSAGADVNIQDNKGWTAVMMATTNTSKKLVATCTKPDLMLVNQSTAVGQLIPDSSVGNTFNPVTNIKKLNPGPMIDDQPTCPFFARYLEPLVDWEPFVFCLPGGITQLDVNIIKTKGSSYLRMKALHKRWLQVNPTASWRDVINALKKCKENELARTIEDKVIDPIAKGNPKDILQNHSDKLVHATSPNLCKVTDALYAKELISQQTKEEVHVLALTNSEKSSKLVNAIEQQLEGSLNPEQYLIDICHVLINQQHRPLTDIATSILHQLGQPIPVQPTGPTPEQLSAAAAVVSEEVDASAKVDVFNIDNAGIKDLIKRHAKDNDKKSGEIPIGGTTIKWKRKSGFSGFQLKWRCTCEDTRTGLIIKGPRKQSRDGALEHCLRELFDQLKKKQ